MTIDLSLNPYNSSNKQSLKIRDISKIKIEFADTIILISLFKIGNKIRV